MIHYNNQNSLHL